MTTDLVRTELMDGVYLSVLRASKFKHNRISVNLIVPMDEETVSGYAVLPFIMRKGFKSCSDFTLLNRRLDSLYGASLAGDTAKAGANQMICFGVKILDDRYALDGEKLLKQAAELLKEAVFEPLIEGESFDEKSFELEKQFLIDTIEAQINDKRSYAVSKCRALMGKGDCAAIPKYGRIEGAKKLTAASAAKSYHQLMKNAAVEIMLTGNGDPEQIAAVMKNAFENISRDSKGFVLSEVRPAGEKLLEETEYLDVAQSKMVLGFRMADRGDEMTQAAVRLMTALYGGTPSSKLFLNVREKLSLCYYCAARYDRMGAIMMVDCGVENANIQAAREEILRQLDAIKNGDFDDETLENTRLQLKNSLRAVSDYPDTLEEWYLSRIVMGSITSPEQEMALLDKVTREQVIEAAKLMQLDAVYLLTSKEEKDAD